MSSRFLLAVAALSLAPLVPASAAPASPAGSSVVRLSEPTGGFSYVPPPGWRVRPFPGMKYKICYTAPVGGFAPNINVVDETAAVGLNEYVRVSMAHMNLAYSTFQLLSQTPFVTSSGLRGVRLVSNGTLNSKNVRQVFYVFPAPKSRKIIATASWLASDGSKYMQAADGAMKTFALK